MAISIPDTFHENELENYDTPFSYSTAFLAQILANQHQDLRVFSNNGVFALRSQSDLDLLTQTQLDPQTQLQLEEVLVSPGEGWQITGTGTTGSLAVGPILSYNNWSGAKITCNGAALSVTLTSSMIASQGGAINITNQDSVSTIFPNFHNFNTTTSTIQLCSNPSGDFSDSRTAPIAFSHNTSSGTEVRIPIGLFVDGGGTANAFSLSGVTGVRIVLNSQSNPTNGVFLILMAIRAVKSTWKPQTLDLQTRNQVFTSVPTLTGADPNPATEGFVPLVRGTGTSSDPRPTDAALTWTFSTGLLTASGVLTPFNSLQLLFRENRGVSDGRYIMAQLQFRNGATKASSSQVTTGVTDPTSVINYTGLPILAANSQYIFQANLSNQSLTMTLYNSNLAGTFLNKIWSSTATSTGTNATYIREQGRVGWNVSLVDRDTKLLNFGASTSAFSTIRTKQFNTYTPVDGAQLAATFSSDTNMWRFFQGQDLFIDTQKSLSGKSYRSTYPIFSNDFFVDDWAQMYINFDIFVPSQVTLANEPYVSLTSSGAFTNIVLPKPDLQPNQWNHVSIDLNQVEGNISGIFYHMWIGVFATGSAQAKVPYFFWVDNVFIGRRNVSWQLSANPGSGVWREFREMVNDPYGALKLPSGERGTAVQLQAIALTQDAWVSDFTLIPHYAELGRLIFY